MVGEAITGHTGGGISFQATRRQYSGLEVEGRGGHSVSRTTVGGPHAGKGSGFRAGFTEEEKCMFKTIRDRARQPFPIDGCRLYPCCYRAGPAGCATCLYCGATFSYSGKPLARRASSTGPPRPWTLACEGYRRRSRPCVIQFLIEAQSTLGAFWICVRKTMWWRERWGEAEARPVR